MRFRELNIHIFINNNINNILQQRRLLIIIPKRIDNNTWNNFGTFFFGKKKKKTISFRLNPTLQLYYKAIPMLIFSVCRACHHLSKSRLRGVIFNLAFGNVTNSP